MFNGVIPNRTHRQRLFDGPLNEGRIEVFHEAEDLDIFALACFAHAGLQKPVQGFKFLGQRPSLQGSRLIERTNLFFQKRQVVEGIEDHIALVVRPPVPGDDRSGSGILNNRDKWIFDL
jgi:hypothetical protein